MLDQSNTPKIDLDHVAFYGRCMDEYRAFAGLDLEALRGKRVLDCPSVAASFAAEAAAHGIHVVAVDPLFSCQLEELRTRRERDIQHVLDKARAVPEMYKWKYFPNFEA